jgi:hypothetical protein
MASACAASRDHRALKAASLEDPAATVAIYEKVAASNSETTRFMDVLAGNVAWSEFFNPANISRWLAGRRSDGDCSRDRGRGCETGGHQRRSGAHPRPR